MPTNSESYECLMRKLGNRIAARMNELHMDQKSLVDESGQSKSTISNIVRGVPSTSVKTVFDVMEKLNMNPLEEVALCTQEFVGQELAGDGLLRTLQDSSNETITYNPMDKAFQGYTGDYYIYFHSTNPNENKCLKGKMHLEGEGSFCRAALHLNTDHGTVNGDSKEYQGYVFISPMQQVVYIILLNISIGEMCFIAFPHNQILSPKRRLECTIGMVLTVSSGIDSRLPTAHRIFLSRVELDKLSEKYVLAQLLMNKSLIRISKVQYDKMCREQEMDPGFLEAIQQHKTEQLYFEIEEKSLKQYLQDHPDSFRDLCRLREYSSSPKNNKINNSVCGTIYHRILQDLIKAQNQPSPHA